ncbi:MAG TPA: ABC transporter substrate-binding protein [Symbiobacteriaceae bacterium]|nr:ABC transporter substrate-binding protein [Symbiobacteriaceae bacterium]
MRKLALIVLAASLLTACSPAAKTTAPAPAAAPAPEATAPKTADPKKVSLILDWYPNAVHSFIYAATTQGYFKEAGLDVAIKMPAENPTDGIKLVGAGKETFALYYQPDVLMARGEGIPVVSVAAVVRKPLNGIMVPADSGIKSPKDLEGKQVGYPGIPLNIPMVKTMVKAAGGDPAKVTLTDISWDLIPAIQTKRVPAIAGGFVNHEKPILEKEGTPMTRFSPADWGVPNYYELVLITGEQTIKSDASTVKAFWTALAKGQDWVKGHKADALKLLVSEQSKDFPVDVDVETKALETLLPLMEEPGTKFGAQSQSDWEKVAAWMVSQGVLKADVKPAEAFADVTK